MRPSPAGEEQNSDGIAAGLFDLAGEAPHRAQEIHPGHVLGGRHLEANLSQRRSDEIGILAGVLEGP
jgi:hypothetical protein